MCFRAALQHAFIISVVDILSVKTVTLVLVPVYRLSYIDAFIMATMTQNNLWEQSREQSCTATKISLLTYKQQTTATYFHITTTYEFFMRIRNSTILWPKKKKKSYYKFFHTIKQNTSPHLLRVCLAVFICYSISLLAWTLFLHDLLFLTNV